MNQLLGLKKEQQPIYFIMDINHPFLFIIRNDNLPSGHDILFICKVEDLENPKKYFSKKSESKNQWKKRKINKSKSKSKSRSRSRSRNRNKK